MLQNVLDQAEAYGSAPALCLLLAALPDDVSVVVKEGVGDFLPLAASHTSNAGVYLNRRYLHLMLEPEDGRLLASISGCWIRTNPVTAYVKVTAEQAQGPHRERLQQAVERAMRRSAASTSAGGRPGTIGAPRAQRLCPTTWELVPVSGLCDEHGTACA